MHVGNMQITLSIVAVSVLYFLIAGFPTGPADHQKEGREGGQILYP